MVSSPEAAAHNGRSATCIPCSTAVGMGTSTRCASQGWDGVRRAGQYRAELSTFGIVASTLVVHAPASMGRGKSDAKPAGLSQLNLNAAGIDVGATGHFVAVPADRAEQPVQEFEAFTADLYRLADWLAECGVETVVMESTGVYWIPLFGVLEERGFQVMLVDPRSIKNVPGRKTDACAAICDSGPCWCSTPPNISSTCRRPSPR